MRRAPRAVLVSCLFVIAGCPGPEPVVDAGMDTPVIPMDTPIAMDDTPPPPECMGLARACGTLDDATCPTVMGCLLTSCRGFAVDCDRLRTVPDCDAQMGCAWTGTGCTGTATECSALGEGAACTSQAGCVMGARQCGGVAVSCDRLPAALCDSQPGCFRMPDAGVDAPIDAPPPPCDPGSTAITLRVVDGTGAPMEGVAVRAEGLGCLAGFEDTTGADGTVTFMVDPMDGEWSVTAARAGYAAVSVLDVLGSTIGTFDGDVRLDPIGAEPTFTPFAVSGTLTGSIGIGHTVQVDTFDFDTIASAASTWSSMHYVRSPGGSPPLRFVALELDPSGDAVNFVAGPEMARPSAPVTGVALALPTPAELVRTHTLDVVWPTTGLLADGRPDLPVAEHVLPGGAYAYAGSARVTASTPSAFTISARDFAPLPVNLVIAEVLGTQLTNLYWWGDLADETRTVGGLDTYSFGGSTLADAAASVLATEWGYAALHLGESDSRASGWRVFGALDRTGAINTRLYAPHLPAGVTPADVGLTGVISALLLVIETDGARPWSLENDNVGVPGYRATTAQSYITLDATGR